MSEQQCDEEVYLTGSVIFVTHTISSANMEVWVSKIRNECHQRIDWHSFSGRAIVKFLGDAKLVREALLNNKNLHNFFYQEACGSLNLSANFCKQNCDAIWKYNGF